VKVLAAGVSLPDILAREGVHPETPRVPYTPGWDLVGRVDQIGEGVSGFELGQTVAAIPIMPLRTLLRTSVNFAKLWDSCTSAVEHILRLHLVKRVTLPSDLRHVFSQGGV